MPTLGVVSFLQVKALPMSGFRLVAYLWVVLFLPSIHLLTKQMNNARIYLTVHALTDYPNRSDKEQATMNWDTILREQNARRRGHDLMTDEVAAQLPPLYHYEAQQDSMWDACPPVKFFGGGWTWYAIEYDAKEGLFFGLVDGLEVEIGMFSLLDLETNYYNLHVMGVGTFQMPIERDLYWVGNKTLRELWELHKGVASE